MIDFKNYYSVEQFGVVCRRRGVGQRGGVLPPRPHSSGREPLGSSGSYRSATGREANCPRGLTSSLAQLRTLISPSALVA